MPISLILDHKKSLLGMIDSLISMKEKTLQGHWQRPFTVTTETSYAGKILWVLFRR